MLTVDILYRDQDKTKAQAKYTDDGSDTEHCSICQNFVAPKTCKVVIGDVVPGGWCKFFEKRA